MSRPKNKEELLEKSRENLDRLVQFIHDLPEKEISRDFPEGTMNRNIRDVLAHLHEWHLMFLGWYQIGMQGKKPAMPSEGYTWKDLPKLNRLIWEKYSTMDYSEAYQLFMDSFNKIYKIIESHSDEELFEKKRYSWTGSTSLGAYLISATSSHYDWAYKLIKKSKKVQITFS